MSVVFEKDEYIMADGNTGYQATWKVHRNGYLIGMGPQDENQLQYTYNDDRYVPVSSDYRVTLGATYVPCRDCSGFGYNDHSVGNIDEYYNSGFDGYIKDVIIWQRPLHESNLVQLAEQGKVEYKSSWGFYTSQDYGTTGYQASANQFFFSLDEDENIMWHAGVQPARGPGPDPAE